ncbi:MAG TPA: hypothetical protein PKD53_17830 [Chloroflexaceae bacterium]|nr:hypothetical protein [Chloroflexaceae bacterium]
MHHKLDIAAPAQYAGDAASWTLRINGGLLLAAGLAALLADLAGSFYAAGPFAELYGQPLAIGAVEAHGLAALVGLLLLRGAGSPGRWGWHAVALGVHLFLGACNLLFWPVYALMGSAIVGAVSTAAHATLFSAQLACLARGGADTPASLPGWVRAARRSGLYVRAVAIGTLLMGAGIHIATIALGREALPRILTPSVELLLTVPMFYVSVAGWLAWPTLRFRGRWHQVALGLILIYFPIGLPFHLITMTTGATGHYAALPDWYSLLIVPVMAAIVTCFAALRLRHA